MLASSVIILNHQNHSGVDRAGFGRLDECKEKARLGETPISSGFGSRIWCGGHELPHVLARGNSYSSLLKYKNVH